LACFDNYRLFFLTGFLTGGFFGRTGGLTSSGGLGGAGGAVEACCPGAATQ